MAQAAAAALIANMTPEQTELFNALHVCGITGNRERATLIGNEQLTGVSDLELFSEDDITEMAKRNQRNIGAQNLRIPEIQVIRLKALAFWLKETRRNLPVGDPLDVTGFTANIIQDVVERMRRKKDESPADSSILNPGKISRDWIHWKETALNFLASMRNRHGVPLSYVVRENDDTAGLVNGSLEWKIQSAHRFGNTFEDDNAKVYGFIKFWALGTENQECMELAVEHDGQAAWNNLVNQNEGDANRSKLVAMSTAAIQRIHWTSEASNFPATSVVNAMTRNYRLLRDAGRTTDEGTKVDALCAKFQGSSDPFVVMTIAAIKRDYPNDFHDASTYLLAEFGRHFPPTENYSRHNQKRKHRVSELAGTPGHEHQKKFKGVDISDPWRTFSNDEKSKLGKEGFAIVKKIQLEQKGNYKPKTGKEKRNVSSLEARIAALEKNKGAPAPAPAAPAPAAPVPAPANTGEKGNQNGTKFGQG